MCEYSETEVNFNSYDGLSLAGAFCDPVGTDRTGACLLVHGITSNREELGFYTRMAAYMAERRVSTLRFEYRCHTSSETSVAEPAMNEMSLLGIVNDIGAAFSEMTRLTGKDVAKYIVGTSFGGGLSAYWCAHNANRVRALVLCAPVLDYEDDIARNAGDWRESLREKGVACYGSNLVGRSLLNEMPHVNGIEALTAPEFPVYIFHGTSDKDVPISSSEAFADPVKNVILIRVPDVGHGFGVEGDDNLEFPETLMHHQRIYEQIISLISRT